LFPAFRITAAPTKYSSRSTSLAASPTFTPEELNQKFGVLKKAFPWNVDVVRAGGWYNLEKLSGQPKEDLVRLIVDGLEGEKSKVEFAANDETLEALVTLLYSMGKGFDADVVDGDWESVFSRQGRKSPKFQRLVGKGEKAGKSMSTFDIKEMTFTGDITVLKKGLVQSKVKVRLILPEQDRLLVFYSMNDVSQNLLPSIPIRFQYSPLSQAYSKTTDGKIVLRRIGCDIVGASFKFWKLPKLPLPLRKKGGYLDFIYMDKDIRVTRGNRGGLFVHFRPAFLKEQLSQ
jgi:hypothetical protein